MDVATSAATTTLATFFLTHKTVLHHTCLSWADVYLLRHGVGKLWCRYAVNVGCRGFVRTFET